MTRIEQAFEQFVEIEREYDVYELTVAGVPVWELVRKRVFNQIFYSYGDDQTQETDAGMAGAEILSSVPANLAKGRQIASNLAFRNPLFAGEYDIIVNSGRRTKLKDGVWWDTICDPVTDRIDRDALYLDPSDDYLKTPLKSDAVRPLQPVRLLGSIKTRLVGDSTRLPVAVKNRIQDIETAITMAFDERIDVTGQVQTILEKRSMELWSNRLAVRQIDPDIAIVVCSWGGKEIFIEACQDENVPVVEMQHGSPSEFHAGYNYRYGTKTTFPDYFFSFGEYWTEKIDFPIPDDRVYDVGYPHFERMSAAVDRSKTENQMVVISQKTIGEQLSKFAVSLADHPGVDLDIVYKLHPSEEGAWAEEYPWLTESGVRVLNSKDKPLYQLFAESDAQVGVYSTAIYEGLTFDLRTFLLDVTGIGYMRQLIETGAVDIVSTADAVADGLEVPPDGTIDTDRLFRPNATERIIKRLTEICQHH